MFTHRLVFPASVLRGRGAILHLGRMCGRLGQRAILIGGKRAIAFVEPQVIEQLSESMMWYAGSEWYGGECSEQHIYRLADIVQRQGIEVIIATGGGRALDTAKAAGVVSNIPVVTLPTVAATCSAITPIAFRYHDDGVFRDMFHLASGPAAAVIDADLLARSPLISFSAGLGDTLAKWYEYRAISDINKLQGLAGVVRTNSELCFTLIENFAADACLALEQGKANAALEQVLDAIFLYAGLTSIMSNGGHTAAAHALYDGFTAIPKTRQIPHGLLVGFGNLCLLALEGRDDQQLLAALALARACSIPLTLDEVADDLTPDERRAIISRALVAPDMKNMPFSVTEEMMEGAIARITALAGEIAPFGRE
ncbi:iron-containing alcohol dehydrogenase family protein [Edaphovirga cremea]|uniref:iron-containing alcohol dehydrogenase family protein n=1 Tax=Edaphovirga cremea TaxID=2267246 RepID=UPI000DEF6380|nr:iron-containing alcohol dehydrogenase family protein [Edaphovirga cremea]